jgi:CDP-paratose 2-epimerase
MRTILITGGAGFVGSNLSMYLKEQYPNERVIALDNLIRPGSEYNLPRLKEKKVEFIKGDIRNKDDFPQIKIDIMIECAAEPSVLAGQDSPEYVINNNLVGAINCLEVARKYNSQLIFLSTSRIYPFDRLSKIKLKKVESRFTLDESGKGLTNKGISEEFPIDGIRSIYGATKLCAEFLIREYGNAYNLPYVINRCGVIAGPWQMGKADQGVFSLWVARHYFKKKLNYIGFGGEGLQVRDLLHIDDLCNLIGIQIEKKITDKTYNIGGGAKCSLSLLETTKLCQEITGNKIIIDKIIDERAADLPWYVTDYSLVKKELGWEPKHNPKKIITDIYSWIKDNPKLSEILK